MNKIYKISKVMLKNCFKIFEAIFLNFINSSIKIITTIDFDYFLGYP